MNKSNAVEWLTKAFHDLDSAEALFNGRHYNDTIGFLLQQSLEKILKSFLAYQNFSIKKTHHLIELYELISDFIELDDEEIRFLAIATNYYTKQRYPSVHKTLPEDDEIREVLLFTKTLFKNSCEVFDIDEKLFNI